MATYKIRLENHSGAQHNYLLFNAPPTLPDQSDPPNVWSNVFFNAPAADTQSVVWTMNVNYSAVVGYANGKPDVGVSVNVGNPVSVNLGHKDSSGNVFKGSSQTMTVIKKAPQFTKVPPKANGGVGAFEIVTDDKFTAQEAIDGNYLIGLGGDPTGTGLQGPAAVFTPLPSTKYQIQPLAKYWLATGEFTPGQMINVTALSDAQLLLHFDTGSATQTVFHQPDGKLYLQAS